MPHLQAHVVYPFYLAVVVFAIVDWALVAYVSEPRSGYAPFLIESFHSFPIYLAPLVSIEYMLVSMCYTHTRAVVSMLYLLLFQFSLVVDLVVNNINVKCLRLRFGSWLSRSRSSRRRRRRLMLLQVGGWDTGRDEFFWLFVMRGMMCLLRVWFVWCRSGGCWSRFRGWFLGKCEPFVVVLQHSRRLVVCQSSDSTKGTFWRYLRISRPFYPLWARVVWCQ